ncbi:MAG TPA: transporter substrate-binding domain-containing protein [Burkholderiales bacterium]|nr:transporter substrate-binding domain-containing protein [Burkholderiales bacterium]
MTIRHEMAKACARLGVVAMALAALVACEAQARTLAEIKGRGTLELCANPDALPYASDKADPPGFQIELARALAQGLGVELRVDWIYPHYRANFVNCDIVMDAFSDPEVHDGKLKLSIPYQKSGVALALAPGIPVVETFDEVRPPQKIGVMIESLASVVLGKKGLRTSPYSFEGDMIEDLINGDIQAAAISPAKVAYYNHTHPERPLGLAYAYDHEPELGWTVSVGMRKADNALVEAINPVLVQMLGDGTVDRIYAKYGVQHRTP